LLESGISELSQNQIEFEKVAAAFSDPNARVGILMSEGGSNGEMVLKNRHLYPSLNFVAICTDREDSGAFKHAETFGLQSVRVSGSVRTPELRQEYFERLSRELDILGVTCLIYAGFMKIATPEFVFKYPGINTHPANLTLLNENGLPRYIGLHVVEKAIRDQLENGCVFGATPSINSSVHVVSSNVDCGQVLLVSPDCFIAKEDLRSPDSAQERLKEYERPTLVKAVQMLADSQLTFKNLPVFL
jgi:phosphoribosylglycinamide formyltransferase 1